MSTGTVRIEAHVVVTGKVQGVWFRAATQAAARGIFRKDYVKQLLDEHVSARTSHHTRLWALLMLAVWQEQQAI